MMPKKQIETFLNWFSTLGVTFFDIHIRKPKSPYEDYKNGNWQWLRHNEKVTADYIQQRLFSWIRYENAHGSDIYFRPHKDKDHAVVFLDDVSKVNAMKIAKKYPSCIVETSPDNTQIWLGIHRPYDKHGRKLIQIFLKNKGYTDPGSISGDHLGRLCGMKSQKHNTWVNLVTVTSGQPYIPPSDTDSTIPISPLDQNENKITNNKDKIVKTSLINNKGGACALKNNSSIDSSQSGKDFGWVLGMLRTGYDFKTVSEKLFYTALKRNKKNPKLYTDRTMNNAKKLIK